MLRQVMIVLLTVVFLGTVAQAGFQIGTRYLDGRPFDPDIDVLDISESLYLSMWTDEWVTGYMERYDWALVWNKSLATITGGEASPDAEIGFVFHFYGSACCSECGWFNPEDEDCQRGTIMPFELPPGLYLDNFLYTPISAGDATVCFLEIHGGTGTIMSVPDSIVIHQVPEPMTLLLLGLGGLALIRKCGCGDATY